MVKIVESEMIEARVVYNKLNKREKKQFIKELNEIIVSDWKMKCLTWFLVNLLTPFLLKFNQFVKRDWCDEFGFLCDAKKSERKCVHFRGKDKVKRGWESLNNRKIIEAL